MLTLTILVLGSPLLSQLSIGIAPTADLGFGDLVAGSSSGSVTIGPDGLRSAAGGVTLGSGVAAGPARFTVTGEPDLSYGIVLPSSATLSSGSESMTVDTFLSDPDGTGTLGASGSQEVRVGATLHVGTLQPQGSYAGTFSVTVAYN